MIALLLAACLNPARIPPRDVYAEPEAPVAALRLSVVGEGAGSGAFAVTLGDRIRRSTTRAWRRLDVPALPVVPVAGRGEARGDPALRGFSAAFGEPWRALDLAIGDRTWRLVVLAYSESPEQRWWIPSAVTGAYDHLLVVLPGPPADPVVARLADAALHHAPPARLMAVFAPGPDAVDLPAGPWGEARVSVSSSCTVRLVPRGLTLSLPGVEAHRFDPRAGWTIEGW